MPTRAAVRAAATLAAFLAAASSSPANQAPPPPRNIAGPGDYALREMIVARLTHDPDLVKEHFVVVLVNGGAVFSGQISTRALATRALRAAALIRGVINVTDEMRVPRADLPDAAVGKAVLESLQSASEPLGLNDSKVRVEDGVATLEGKVRSFPARVSAEDVVGSVVGVTGISNHLRPVDAPTADDDPSLLKAVVKYLGDWHTFPHPGSIWVSVKDGTVTLTGQVPYFLARQQAAVVASLVGGTGSVLNHIKIDATFPLPTPGAATAVVRARP